MTTDELKAAMDSAATVNKFSNLGMLLGPIGALGGIAIQATMRSRGIQIGKAAEEKLKSTDKSSAEYAKLVELVKRGGIASSGPTGWIAGKLAKKAQENAVAAKEGEVDPTPTITAKVSSADITKTSSNSINEGAQTKGAKERLDAKIEAERKAADAARFAQATAAGNTRITQKRRTGGGGDNGGGSSGGGGMPGGDTSTTDVLGNTTSTPGGSNKPNTSAGNYGDDGGPGGNTGRDDVMSGGGGYSAPQEDYDSSGPFNKGGLINKPKKKSYANGGYVTANEPAKKKKKRKVLGTRP